MTPQEDNEATDRLSTKVRWRQVADTVWGLLVCLGFSIGFAYFLVYGEPRFDQIHTKYGMPPDVSEIALWGVALLFYIFAVVGAWGLKNEVKAHRLGHKCALVFAVLLTVPVCLVALLIALLIVILIWKGLNSMSEVVLLFISFLICQGLAEKVNHKKFLTIANMLTEIQQSVRNIEKEEAKK
jgi:uncharacterized protein YacL